MDAAFFQDDELLLSMKAEFKCTLPPIDVAVLVQTIIGEKLLVVGLRCKVCLITRIKISYFLYTLHILIIEIV
jgi:hypothetical protein